MDVEQASRIAAWAARNNRNNRSAGARDAESQIETSAAGKIKLTSGGIVTVRSPKGKEKLLLRGENTRDHVGVRHTAIRHDHCWLEINLGVGLITEVAHLSSRVAVEGHQGGEVSSQVQIASNQIRRVTVGEQIEIADQCSVADQRLMSALLVQEQVALEQAVRYPDAVSRISNEERSLGITVLKIRDIVVENVREEITRSKEVTRRAHIKAIRARRVDTDFRCTG